MSLLRWLLPAACVVGATVTVYCVEYLGVSWDSGILWGSMGSKLVLKAAVVLPSLELLSSVVAVQCWLWELPPGGQLPGKPFRPVFPPYIAPS